MSIKRSGGGLGSTAILILDYPLLMVQKSGDYHLGCKKNPSSVMGYLLYINWCRISSINSMMAMASGEEVTVNVADFRKKNKASLNITQAVLGGSSQVVSANHGILSGCPSDPTTTLEAMSRKKRRSGSSDGNLSMEGFFRRLPKLVKDDSEYSDRKQFGKLGPIYTPL